MDIRLAMIRKLVATILKYGALLFLLFTFLFGDSISEISSGLLGSALREIIAVLCNPARQWMFLLCLGLYFVAFISFDLSGSLGFWQVANPKMWLICVLLCGVICTFFYSSSVQTIIFLTGAVVGQSIVVLVKPQRERKKDEGRINVRRNIVLILMTLFVLAIVRLPTFGATFGYQGHVRWSGPWDNPNIAGLLMGTGFLLALAFGAESLMLGVGCVEGGILKLKEPEGNWSSKFSRRVCAFLCLITAILVGHALLRSYSRGAWVATACGFGYLFWRMVQSPQYNVHIQLDIEVGTRKIKCLNNFRMLWFGKNWLPISVTVVSMCLLVFWQFGHSKRDAVADRVFSVANINDFSWRNRIAALDGALQITAEHPWFGAGWSRPESLYNYYYLSSNLDESAAIKLNDYLTLGATLGVPALICFGIYIWLSLMQKSGVWSRKLEVEKAEIGKQKTEIQLDWLRTTCRAGAIVPAVGFWFDGGLFKLATASVFWILLELGREDLPRSKETQISRRGTN